MRKIKVGVVGIGYLGYIHAKIYKELENCELTAICDIDKEKLKKAETELDVEGFLDYKKLFSRVEAVSIVTPSSSHYQITYDFLKAGISVLVEKPFTSNLKQADYLINLAKKKNLILQVGHVERFNSAFQAVEKIIKKPLFIECHRLSYFPQRSLDIGVVLDLMIHDIDIILGIVNSEIKRIEAIGIPVLTSYEDIANARIIFKNGCICNLTASRISDEIIRKIRIFTEEFYISLDYKNEEAFLYRKINSNIIKENLPIDKEEPLKKELSHFIECNLYHKEPLVSGEVARQALAVAFIIQEQIWKRKKY